MSQRPMNNNRRSPIRLFFAGLGDTDITFTEHPKLDVTRRHATMQDPEAERGEASHYIGPLLLALDARRQRVLATASGAALSPPSLMNRTMGAFSCSIGGVN